LRHGLAAPRKAGQHVFKLRQLHLQLPFARPGMARKNIQNQLRAVEHPARQRGFKVAQLRGRQVAVEKHQVGCGRSSHCRDLFHLSLANEGRRIGARTPLHQLRSHSAAGARNQLAELGDGLFDIEDGKRMCASLLRSGTRQTRRLNISRELKGLALGLGFRGPGFRKCDLGAFGAQPRAARTFGSRPATFGSGPAAVCAAPKIHSDQDRAFRLAPQCDLPGMASRKPEGIRACYRCSTAVGVAAGTATGAGPIPV
jgi:hypothetical protein